MLLRALDLALAAALLPLLAATGYLCFLALMSRRTAPPPPGPPEIKFDLVIPAHDEEPGIARTVRDLLALDYPRDLFRVLVVADNCADRTADRAREAGAVVLERHSEELRGKGYALAHAFEHSAREGFASAVVVVDADTLVSPNLLTAFQARLKAGARAVQADYAVQNPGASWRTRLIRIALGMFHVLRSQAREHLRVSCGLRGNGMCFSHALLKEVPHDAFSVVEDLEYGIRLGRAGYRVHYAGEAHVYGEMVSTERAARSQRRRWEDGRRQIARTHGPPLLKEGLRRRDPLSLDLAMDVLVPPLAAVAGGVVVALALSAPLYAALHGTSASAGVAGLCALCVAAYVGRGWWLSGAGARGLVDLLFAPAYVAWKVALKLRRPAHRPGEWVRTTRETRS
ncbi:MAG TPA: glycosyltransferase [Myxococcales bacterium]|nr:glycosyltransferase [Myxococcales bacterium]